MQTKHIIYLIIVLFLFLSALIFRGVFVAFVDNYELGFKYNKFDGTVTKLSRTGYFLRNPFKESIHSLDLRPYQVTVSANSRILNAKLVRFDSEGLDKFVEWHGRDAGDNINQLLEILKSYAFALDEGADCPFLLVLGVVKPTQIGDLALPQK